MLRDIIPTRESKEPMLRDNAPMSRGTEASDRARDSSRA